MKYGFRPDETWSMVGGVVLVFNFFWGRETMAQEIEGRLIKSYAPATMVFPLSANYAFAFNFYVAVFRHPAFSPIRWAPRTLVNANFSIHFYRTTTFRIRSRRQYYWRGGRDRVYSKLRCTSWGNVLDDLALRVADHVISRTVMHKKIGRIYSFL